MRMRMNWLSRHYTSARSAFSANEHLQYEPLGNGRLDVFQVELRRDSSRIAPWD